MTRSEFMTLVLAYIAPSGIPYATSSVEQNKACNRLLQTFVERTRLLYDDKVAMTLVQDQAKYNIRSASAFAKKFLEVRHVLVDSAVLRDLKGDPGSVSLTDLETAYPEYFVAASAKPKHWTPLSLTEIRLHPAPDHVYTGCFASGYTLPAVIDTSGTGDTVEIEIPDEHCDVAAVFVAVGLMNPNKANESDFNRMAALSKPAAEAMSELEQEARRNARFRTRGAHRDRPARSLA